MSDAPPPYRSGFAAGLGVSLTAGLVMSIVDIVHTGSGAAAPALLGLWAILALPLGVAVGIVLAAGNATWGAGWISGLFRRLRDDAELDRTVSAILIAAALLGGVLAFGVGKLAILLVGEVQRKGPGGLLLGVAVVVAIPLLALGALPIYRVTRWITAVVPAIGPLSRVVLLLLGIAVLAVAAALFVIFKQLDYQKLNLGALAALAALPIVALAFGLVFYGPAAKLRERIPARGVIVAVATVIALAIPVASLRGTPSPAVVDAVMDHSYIAAPIEKWPGLVGLLRKLIDHDHDGYSAFFGGPDCDDHNPNIHPGAVDIPDNGIDENCAGGDAHVDHTTRLPDTARDNAPKIAAGDNVLIIFIDTLRFDRLGIAGYKREGKSLTPRLDAFANQAVVFRHAYSQAPNTPRSVPSFLASRYPSQLVVDKQFKDYATIADDNDLLFEALHPAGLRTIGETSHFYFCDRIKHPETCADVLNTDGTPMHSNIVQGADEWDNTDAKSIPDSNHDIAGPRIVAKTLAKLDALAQDKTKFAMLVHLFEPHSTYMEHPGYTYKEHGTAALEEKYDYEIAFDDGLVGQLLDALDKNGLAANTTVVVMADHGEAFGVHTFAGQQMFFHGQTLYQELLHVPLMFRVPHGAACMRDDVVQLVDLAPTLAALFGAQPPSTWAGRSLAAALACKDPLPPKPAFAEMLPAPEWDHAAKSMISSDGKRHVFYRISDNRWEIYDLDADPDEKHNIADSDPNAKALEGQLTSWMEGPLAAGGGK